MHMTMRNSRTHVRIPCLGEGGSRVCLWLVITETLLEMFTSIKPLYSEPCYYSLITTNVHTGKFLAGFLHFHFTKLYQSSFCLVTIVFNFNTNMHLKWRKNLKLSWKYSFIFLDVCLLYCVLKQVRTYRKFLRTDHFS